MNTRPKIICTVTNDLVHDQRMIRICSTLHEMGYEVMLVGRTLSGSKPLRSEVFLQKRLSLFFQSGKLFYAEYNFRLFIYLLFQRFSAVCSVDLDTAIPGILACRWRGKTHFFDAHELFPHVPEVERRPMIQWVWKKVEKWVFAKTHVAYTVGNALAQYFTETYKVPVAVVRNMPLPRQSIPEFWPNSLPEYLQSSRFLLYQGALNEGRGLENLLAAMPNLSIPLVLVGDGDISEKLKQYCQIYQLNHVHFTGFISPQHLPAIASKAWLGINVSENAGLSYYLSLNNKFFDYIQDQLPSVINPFPEYLQLLQEFQVGVTCESNPEELIAVIQSLLSNPTLYNQLKNNCAQAAKQWNWETEKMQLLKIYQAHLPLP